ncbi:hypothetical protein FACS1894201_05090 [Bacteroidia bacterium]|nr:hypothetical protein FACS1894201_05090 [Bacteroidia bacterium]
MQKIDALMDKGHYTEAIKGYEQLVKKATSSKKAPTYDVAQVYSRLGEAYLKTNQFVKAEASFASAKEKNIKETEGNYLLYYGDVLMGNGKYMLALETYKQYKESHPNDEEVASARIRKAEFAIQSSEDPRKTTVTVVPTTALNTNQNNQTFITWYRDALLFSSDRDKQGFLDKVASKTITPTTAFVARLFHKDVPAPARLFTSLPIVSDQPDKADSWKPIEPVKDITTTKSDKAFAFDANTTTYYVMRNHKVSTKNNKFLAFFDFKKSEATNIFSYTLTPKGSISKKANIQSFHDNDAVIGYPTLSSDGKIMFFVMAKNGSTSDIYVTKSQGDNMWSSPIRLGTAINTNGDEAYPQLYNDSILFFASNGHAGMGGFDIFYSKITVDDVAHAVSGATDLSQISFTVPINMQAPINSGADDYGFVVKKNGQGGLFVSNRTSSGKNLNAIHDFREVPYVFDEKGTYTASKKNTVIAEKAEAQAEKDTIIIGKPAETAAGGTPELNKELKLRDEKIAQQQTQIDALAQNLNKVISNQTAQQGAQSQQQGASPAQQGASPAQQGASPAQQGASPAQQGASPVQQGASPAQQRASPAQQGASPVQQGAYPQQQGAYPQQQGAYPQQQGASPQQQGAYPQQQGAYPQQQGAYPQQQGAYPQQQGAYPQQQGAYPQQQGAYPQQQGAYPQQQGAYPQQQGAYPQQQGAYPQQQGAYPQQQGAYPQQQGAYPQQQSGYYPAQENMRSIQQPNYYDGPVNDQLSVFRIQLTANKTLIDFSVPFKNLLLALPSLRLEIVTEGDGLYRCMSLPFATFADADVMRNQIKSLGYQCFVAEYRGNQRVSVNVK